MFQEIKFRKPQRKNLDYIFILTVILHADKINPSQQQTKPSTRITLVMELCIIYTLARQCSTLFEKNPSYNQQTLKNCYNCSQQAAQLVTKTGRKKTGQETATVPNQ